MRLNVGLHKVRRNEPHGVPIALQRTCPEVRACASFHADQARRQVYEQSTHLAAMDLTPQRNLAVAVHAVQLKNVLCQIDPDACNIHGARSHPQ